MDGPERRDDQVEQFAIKNGFEGVEYHGVYKGMNAYLAQIIKPLEFNNTGFRPTIGFPNYILDNGKDFKTVFGKDSLEIVEDLFPEDWVQEDEDPIANPSKKKDAKKKES